MIGRRGFLAEAERLNLPLNPVAGADDRALVPEEATAVRALYARHPWASR